MAGYGRAIDQNCDCDPANNLGGAQSRFSQEIDDHEQNRDADKARNLLLHMAKFSTLVQSDQVPCSEWTDCRIGLHPPAYRTTGMHVSA